jgi:hypothetical protein
MNSNPGLGLEMLLPLVAVAPYAISEIVRYSVLLAGLIVTLSHSAKTDRPPIFQEFARAMTVQRRPSAARVWAAIASARAAVSAAPVTAWDGGMRPVQTDQADSTSGRARMRPASRPSSPSVRATWRR